MVEQNTRNLPTMNAETTQTSEAISSKSFAGHCIKKAAQVPESFKDRRRHRSVQPKAAEPDPTAGLTSKKKKIREAISQVPRKYREQVASYISTRAYEEKFRIDKGLVGSAGAMKKAVRAVEALEEYAIEKIQ